MHLAKLVQVEGFWLFYQIFSSIMHLGLNYVLACGIHSLFLCLCRHTNGFPLRLFSVMDVFVNILLERLLKVVIAKSFFYFSCVKVFPCSVE